MSAVLEEIYQKKGEEHKSVAKKHVSFRPANEFHTNDYSNNHIHTGSLPQSHIRNIENTVDGYPKLQKLFSMKEKQVMQYNTKPFGCTVELDEIVPTLNDWIQKDNLTFDVVMIGCLTDNQFIYPLLTQLPINRLISKPGFLFVWGSAQKINELSRLLSNEVWAKKFRRSEELVFVPVNKNSPFYPGLEADDESLFNKMQWHCWMCITGTVRRATDGHLIHCNVDTDLAIETNNCKVGAIPNQLYKVAENFSTATRRLHIVPARTGSETPIRMRPGWVIMGPDVLLNNFNSKDYKNEISRVGSNLPKDPVIESLRPKSPVSNKN